MKIKLIILLVLLTTFFIDGCIVAPEPVCVTPAPAVIIGPPVYVTPPVIIGPDIYVWPHFRR